MSNPGNTQLFRGLVNEIDFYESGKTNLPRFVDALNAVVQSMVGNLELKENLRRHWWELEQANAFALEEGKTRPLAEDQAKVAEALKELRSLLLEEV